MFGGILITPPLIVPQLPAPTVEIAQAPQPPKPPTLAHQITLIIAEMEGDGDGASGEHGPFQYLPATWTAYSTEVLGYDAPQTLENATLVTEQKVQRWLDEGKTPRDIFLIWNQGYEGPCISGVNRYGVAYDSCAYADVATKLLKDSTATSP